MHQPLMIIPTKQFAASSQQHCARQSGSSLIEVLVTMLIVAIGLLGYAGLLATTVKNNNSAFLRSQATFLANDVLERLRLNRTTAITGNCNVAFGAAPPNAPNTLTNCAAALRSDLGDWKNTVSAVLPAGDASLSVNNTGAAVINVQWDEDGDGVVTSFSTRSLI
ncbi:type IV pilus modification protein PilV [Methylomonas koyamae]|uniref:type IV pilus modification protein PilV n=2 Tax=Methylomonas koyamae TaxID=702114 RepID=UPI0006D15AE3